MDRSDRPFRKLQVHLKRGLPSRASFANKAKKLMNSDQEELCQELFGLVYFS